MSIKEKPIWIESRALFVWGWMQEQGLNRN
jgi:hypothetical protein